MCQASEMFGQRGKKNPPTCFHDTWNSGAKDLNGRQAESRPFSASPHSPCPELACIKAPPPPIPRPWGCKPWRQPAGCCSSSQHRGSGIMPFSASEISAQMCGPECSLSPGVLAAFGAGPEPLHAEGSCSVAMAMPAPQACTLGRDPEAGEQAM